jgi:hypothetical protein
MSTRDLSTSETSFLQIGLMFSNVTVDFPVHSHSPDRQRNLRGDIIRSKPGVLGRLTYASENVQGPVFEEETARGGSFRRGAEHSGDPISSYVTVVIFDS